MNPVVSVIIPIYNVEKYIRTCLNSVLSQTVDNIEILLVDDCGNDRSIEIVEEIAGAYCGAKEIEIIKHEINSGQSEARNTGIRNAKGNFFFFIDSDDLLNNDKALEIMLDRQRCTDADIVMGNTKMFDDITGKQFKTVDEEVGDGFFQNDGNCSNPPFHIVVWNKLIKRSFIIENNLMFDSGLIYEDNLWSFKALCCSPSVATIKEYTYGYRYRCNSTMTTLQPKHIISSIMLPLLAQRYVSKYPTMKRRYAYGYIQDLKFGALQKILMYVDDTSFYGYVYGIFRESLDFKPKYLTFRKIFREINEFLPKSLGESLSRVMHKRKIGGKSTSVKFNDVYVLKNTLSEFLNKIK